MNVNGKLAKHGPSEAVDARVARLVRKLKNEIKPRLIEQKTWRELLAVDNLTINGAVVWKDGRLSRAHRLRHRK